MAGRPRTIDREKVLDAAEQIVMAEGASGLTFDALAKAAGITKGGLQYCFGSKENLIRAMISRWSEGFEGQVAALTGPDPEPKAVIRAHLRVTETDEIADHSRSAAMMTALLERPDQVASSREWYAERLAGLDLSRAEDRRVAVAFLAGEGAFLLKTLGLIRFSPEDWTALFEDMQKLTRTE